jgi:hypothetical protein
LFDGFDHRHRTDGEASCCRLIIWARDPDEFAKEGVLRLEELHDRLRQAWHFANQESARPHAGLISVLCYAVIIDIDHVTDFRLSVDASAEWPECHSFRWRLGFCDD